MTKEIIRVLLVEDSMLIRAMVRKMLAKNELCQFEVTECENLTEGVLKLKEGNWDIVILDLSLPESNGVETVSRIREIDTEIPVVVFTGSEDENLAMAAMHLGADDYLVKKEVQQGSLLSRTLRYSIEQKKAKLALNRYAVEMERLAETRARQLIHQDRLAAIGTMSAGVAHEIRGPLTYIADNTHALADQWKDISALLSQCTDRSSQCQNDIDYIQQETPKIFADIFSGIDRITQITTGLKKFSRKNDSELTTARIEDVVENALTLCSNLLKYGIEIQRDYHTSEVYLPMKQQKMVQVFVNLFYNAAQAMEHNGVLTISTNVEDDILKVEVNDTGPGIPPDTLDAIWDPFFTTKSEETGTGLGLSICKEIVQEHGGTILADNGSNGARFLMTFPWQQDEPASPEPFA